MKKVIAFFKGLFSAPAQPVVAAPVANKKLLKLNK